MNTKNDVLPVLNTDEHHLGELRKSAVEFVTRGYPIVPMGLNRQEQDYKSPLIRWKNDGPLASVEAVERCFDDLGKRVFGIATIVKGYTLVDFDTMETPKLFTDLELTPTIRTGKGYHMWYAADSGLKQNGPIDLSEYEKRDGKKYQLEVYTKERLEILPPSKHHSGVIYEWGVDYKDFSELPKLPESIAKLCKRESQNDASVLTNPVSEGERHSRILQVAGLFARQHRGSKQEVSRHTHEWNRKNCTPPLPEGEVNDVIEWIVDNFKESNSKPISKSKRLQSVMENDPGLMLFHDQNEIGYGRIGYKGRQINVPIYSKEFRQYVLHRFFQETRESLSNKLLEENLALLNAKAIYDSAQHELHNRVVSSEGSIFYDLLDKQGGVVKINENGWDFIPGSEAPFLFKVGQGLEQVRPVAGGNLKQLLEFVNIKDPSEQMLYLSTLPVRFIRDIDQAIVYIHGPAGSAKTTLLKMTKDLLDPSAGGISMPIKKVDDVIPMLNQTWVFANDNISKINDELSNFLCVVATGAENARRTLYTDSGVTVLKVKNPTYLTGINVEAYRSDLMSRMLVLKTETIQRKGRLSGNDVNQRFIQLKPQLLGAIFDTLSKAMKIRQTLKLSTEFRMADFALWGAACAQALGYGAVNFENAIQKAMKSGAYDAIYSSSAGRAVLELLETEDEFNGTATELLRKLKDTDDGLGWYETVANNPSSLAKKLRELQNSFAAIGITVDFGRRSSRERMVAIRKEYDGSDG